MDEKTLQDETNRYMNMPVRDWPDSLKLTVDLVGKRIGHSGDVFYECVLAWLKAGGDKFLTYEEVFK